MADPPPSVTQASEDKLKPPSLSAKDKREQRRAEKAARRKENERQKQERRNAKKLENEKKRIASNAAKDRNQGARRQRNAKVALFFSRVERSMHDSEWTGAIVTTAVCLIAAFVFLLLIHRTF